MLYDVAHSPLPKHNPRPVLKGGFNRWETMLETPMQKAQFEYPQPGEWGEWYKVDIDIPIDTFEFVYVVYDKKTNIYDNNSGIDFSMTLDGAPTEEEVKEGRMQRYRDIGRRRVLWQGAYKKQGACWWGWGTHELLVPRDGRWWNHLAQLHPRACGEWALARAGIAAPCRPHVGFYLHLSSSPFAALA